MKKNLFWCLLVVVTAVMTACTDSVESNYHRKTVELSTRKDSRGWEFDSIARQFYCHFEVSALTRAVYSYGNWSLSQEENKNGKYPYQVLLPRNAFYTDTITEPTVVYYTQHIDYRVGIGYLEIQLTNSDYLYAQENPESMYFRLQTNNDVLDLTIAHEDWKWDEQTRQFYYRFDLSEITADVYDYGFWTIHREYNKGTTDAYQAALPLSAYMTDTLMENELIHYQAYMDYRVGVGYIEVQITNSDHLYLTDTLGKYILPDDMNFRLQLIY